MSRADNSPETWLDQHGDALYAFAVTRVGNTAVAEDLLQETLLAALSADSRFESRASVRTWLTAILKNKIVDYLRKSGREVSYTPDTDDEGDVDAKFDHTGHWARSPLDWGDPAHLAENADLAHAMNNCIESLPQKLRVPFVLKEIDGMETEAVVDLLEISSSNNLWVILSRGRERVRGCLERNWYEGKR